MATFFESWRRTGWRLLKTSAVIGAIALGVYLWKFAPSRVVEHRVERGDVVAEVMGAGTLEARVAATISSKIAGRIDEVFVDEGKRVAAGDLLVRLDDAELRQQVAIAEARVEAATAAIERLKTDKRRAEAVFQQAQKSAERTRQLAEKNAASEQEVDKTTEALAVAIADVSRSEAAITEGQEELVAAKRTLQYHQARLQDAKIAAPFDGLIVKRTRESGDVVVPGSRILTLISTDELWITAWVDETQTARLAAGQQARVVFRSEPDHSYPGEVVRIGREADRETREFVVDVSAHELPKNWAVGQRAEAYIEVAQQDDALVLPAELLVHRDGATGVFVNAGGVARWRTIVPGLRSRDAIEVRDGLAVGDSVIAPRAGGKSLTDGQRVVTQ